MIKEDVNNRAIQAIEYLLSSSCVPNKTELAQAFDIKPAKFSEILNKRMNAGTDIMSILCERFNISSGWLLTGKGEMIHTATAVPAPAGQGIPLIPVEAFAGHGSPGFDDLKVEEYYNVAEFRNADFLLRVKGNSMYPKYSSGDLIACNLVRETLFFQWNKIYAVRTGSQGVMVKRIKKSGRDDCILLVSDNPNYEPFDVPLSDIRALALVIGVIRVE